MKTQIIQLEPHDDIDSARDRMGWGQTSRILLVWPPRGRVLDRRLDLVLLKRRAAELGSQLALVTADPEVRFYARQLAIPVFENVRQAERASWRPPRRRRTRLPDTSRPLSPRLWRQRRLPLDLEGLRAAAHPPTPRWLTHLITRLTAFSLGVFSVLAIAALLLPSARLNLHPETITQRLTIPVSASPQHQTVELNGQVPAHWRPVIVEGRDTLAVSGRIPIPDKPARGEVVFTNLSDQSLQIPAGTVVSTLDDPPVRFTTQEDVTLEAAATSPPVAIQAVDPGAQGNVPAESIRAIEGPLGLNLLVVNPTATYAGSNRSAPAPSAEDYDRLYATLYAALAESALQEIQASLSPGDLLLSAEPRLRATLEKKYTPAEPQPGNQLELVLRLEFEALVVSAGDLEALARQALSAALQSSYQPLPETLSLEHRNPPRLSAAREEGRWAMQASWQAIARISPQQAIRLALGLRPEQAARRLAQQLPLESTPQIQPIPSWWPRLPVLPFRFQVSLVTTP